MYLLVRVQGSVVLTVVSALAAKQRLSSERVQEYGQAKILFGRDVRSAFERDGDELSGEA